GRVGPAHPGDDPLEHDVPPHLGLADPAADPNAGHEPAGLQSDSDGFLDLAGREVALELACFAAGVIVAGG
ncbi:MAG: hypothetical protein OEW85_11720, partial [Acidimicrobiia bacterium]|nr:hypothetical protein [Acidimicrobiia bacterium]